MTEQTCLDDLVIRYEELRKQQSSVVLEELCRDCPELLDELKQKVQVLEAMNAFLDGGTGEESDTSPGRSEPAAESGPEGPGGVVTTEARLRLLRPHAAGGLGEVLVAYDEQLHREVALKRLHGPHTQSPHRLHRFRREAEITSRLEHPGIVPVHAAGHDSGGHPFYAMRLIRGETLHEAIRHFHADESRQLPPRERRLALRQLLGRFVTVCNTTAYAHSQGVIHRDIKPDNIILGPYGETLLIDWGLAKVVASGQWSVVSETGTDDSSSRTTDLLSLATVDGAVLGTPAYMSPEQAEGRRDAVGPATDVYSLGATLYALLAGRSPFQGVSLAKVLNQVRRGEFPLPRQQNREVHPALEAVCLKAMARLPEARYASAEDLARDIEHWLADEPVSAWREPWTVRARRWLGRHRTLVTASAATTVAATLILAGATWLLLAAYRSESLARTNESHARVEAQQNLVKAQIEAAISYNSRGNDLYMRLNQMKDADTQYRQALASLAKIPAEYSTGADVQSIRARIFTNQGTLRRIQRKYDEARQSLDEALAIRIALAEANPTVPVYQEELAGTYQCLGQLHRDAGQPLEAVNAFLRAKEIWERLVRAYPAHFSYQRSFIQSWFDLAEWYQAQKKEHEARKAYLQVLHLGKKLTDAGDRGATQLTLAARACCGLGDLASWVSDAAVMLWWYDEATAVVQAQPALEARSSKAILDHASRGRAKALALLENKDTGDR